MATQHEVAHELAAFLTRPSNFGDRLSPLETAVRRHIDKMANDIALEVIEATPELVKLVRRRAEEAVRAAMRDDPALHRTVINAMAAGLGKYVAELASEDT